MKFPSRTIRGFAVALLVAAGAVTALVAPAGAASSAPVWEPDSQAQGTISFYDDQGNPVTSGTLDSQFAAYAVGSAPVRDGDVSAAVFGAQPNPNADIALWNVEQWTAFDTYPITSGAPASIQALSQTHPVATIGAQDETLGLFIADYPNTGSTGLGCAYAGTPAGCTNTDYENLYQIRLMTADTGGHYQTTAYDTADVLVTGNAWQQVYPATATATSTVLATSPTGGAAPGADVTLTATVTPADAAGTVQFMDDATALGTSQAVSSGSAHLVTTALSVGSHTLTAVFTPTDSNAFSGSQSAAAPYVIADLPAAPTGIGVAAGDGSVRVSWTAPTDNGGAPLLGYDIRYSSDGGTSWTSASSAFHHSTATSQTVSGLTDGASYVFQVAAINAVGTGGYSASSTSVKPVIDISTATIGAPKSVRYGSSAKITTKLGDATTHGALGGRHVTLYRRANSHKGWSPVKTVTTASNGTASVSLTMTADEQFQFRYAGDSLHRGVTTSTASVRVSQVVAIHRSVARVKHTHTVKIWGTVSPSGAGQRVTLQKLVGRTWRSIGTAKITRQLLPNHRRMIGYVFTVRLKNKGTFKFHVAKAATSTLAAGTSGAVSVTAT